MKTLRNAEKAAIEREIEVHKKLDHPNIVLLKNLDKILWPL
jgi:serine/threonine protein kinase